MKLRYQIAMLMSLLVMASAGIRSFFSYQTQMSSLAITCAVLVLGIVLSFILADRIAQPIAKLAEVARDIAAGNWRTGYRASGSSELASLSQGLAAMSESIRDKVRELQQNLESLEITLRSIGGGVIATDGLGKVARMNLAAETLTGWTERSALGRPLEEVFRIEDAPASRPAENLFVKVMRAGKVAALAEHTVLLSRDGTRRQVAGSCAPIVNAAGGLAGVVLAFHDVAGNYQLEMQLRQAERMDAIGALAGGIAHDFNNVLMGIMGLAELLELQLPEGSSARQDASRILAAAGRAADLTKKLLAFSRKANVPFVPLNIHECIRAALVLLEGSNLDKRMAITLDLDAPKSVIAGDAPQLESAFLNLGLNARDAMPNGGRLAIRTSTAALDAAFCQASAFELQPGDYVRVTVRDTGIGISKETLWRIFEPFFTTKEAGKGTGLGLAAVYGTVKSHHGAILVQSEEGKGAVFDLYFPLAQVTEAQKNGPREPPAGSGGVPANAH
ncbi:MAG: ATP-binding protein [Planctomycetota bacterium]